MSIIHIPPVYTGYEGTPLRWYHFLTKILLPLQILLSTGQLLREYHAGIEGYFNDPASVIWLVNALCMLGLLLTALVQLNRRRWMGVLAYLATWGLGLVYSLLLAAYFFAAGYPQGVTVMGREAVTGLLSALLFVPPNWIYFGKRRLLFVPLPGESL